MNDLSQFEIAGATDVAEAVPISDALHIPAVVRAIAAVMADVSETGISKSHNNTTQNYKFRGIDDVYNALSPIMSKHRLFILPRMLSRQVTERPSSKGGVLFYVVVDAEFDFVCADDNSRETVRMFGEAMDSGDKATNKAMSAAFKYACMQTFCIPTEGDNDADATTHNVASDKGGNRQGSQRQKGKDRQQRGRNDAANPMPDEEWANLANLLRATNSIAGDLCDHYGVSNLRFLNEDAYRDAIALLKMKLERLKNRQQGNGQGNQRQQGRAQGRTQANGQNFDPNNLPSF